MLEGASLGSCLLIRFVASPSAHCALVGSVITLECLRPKHHSKRVIAVHRHDGEFDLLMIRFIGSCYALLALLYEFPV